MEGTTGAVPLDLLVALLLASVRAAAWMLLAPTLLVIIVVAGMDAVDKIKRGAPGTGQVQGPDRIVRARLVTG